MFDSFTGSSRRPRQVNLSGRTNSNPFAKNTTGGGFGGGGSTSHGTSASSRSAFLANAQQDRLARQQERQRAQAATLVQKTWRGNTVRKGVRTVQRSRWDEVDQRAQNGDTVMTTDGDENMDSEAEVAQPYSSESEALSQLWMLLRFMDLQRDDDLSRLLRFYGRLRLRQPAMDGTATSEHSSRRLWTPAYLKLEQTCLGALEKIDIDESRAEVVEILKFVIRQIPEETALHSQQYYKVLAELLARTDIDVDLIVIPLQTQSRASSQAYENFSLSFLTKLGSGGAKYLEAIARKIQSEKLGNALATKLRNASQADVVSLSSIPTQQRLRLLGYVIYFYRFSHNFKSAEKYASNRDFILVVGTLLSSLVDEVDIEPLPLESDSENSTSKPRRIQSVDPFIQDQIKSLVNEESIGGLLVVVGSSAGASAEAEQKGHSRALASYILTLLRMFPKRSNEIRMWLYMGLSSSKNVNGESLPAIRYFWTAASSTEIFDAISHDPRAAVAYLRPRQLQTFDQDHKNVPAVQTEIDDQWRVILIFIELYLFVLKVTDDEEFFSGGRASRKSRTDGQKNTLSLEEVQSLSTFLKHLGFTMYYNVADILGHTEEIEQEDISSLFRLSKATSTKASSEHSLRKDGSAHIAGVQGVSLDYVKGELVTTLLRAIYERDSRRPFLPKGHWLMTSRFDMSSFIDAVVEEEERRHKVHEEDEEDVGVDDPETYDFGRSDRLVGTWHAQRTRKFERLQHQLRKESQRRYLQRVAPRLEILQNMPFVIPFTTRVQIFRRFVYLDQLKRRSGVIDGEMWRLQQMHDQTRHERLARHHAKIRREHEFDDAYEQYYDLGAGLKEPIQITFVDKFDTVEAGIDGGGVTKEFLTSVTNQVFAPSDGGIKLFTENEQHLFYPNPSAIDEQEELLREVGIKEGGKRFRAQISDLLQRYEFLGRIIGKCLYEGILIDVGFANFFLRKWALTGGSGTAPREAGHLANLNDLRDFDEGLYQGLLQLKNYPGDVEDFSLNFTVTDTLSMPGSDGSSKTVTRELVRNGAQQPVTNANRLAYIAHMSRHRIQTQPSLQTTSFLRGLASMVQPSWLSMFNQSELQTLVGGSASSISISDLRANTAYGGVYSIGDDNKEHPSVEIFWDVMESLSDEERGKVLKFVTSTPRAPLLGFASLNPPFSIRDAGRDETRLPSTSTCVNLLKLPQYTRKKACREKLLQAVNSGAGFDLS